MMATVLGMVLAIVIFLGGTVFGGLVLAEGYRKRAKNGEL